MATTDDLYSWLYNPQLYYDPRTQSYRTPGFTQATYWQDPAAVRAVEPIRSDPTVAPPTTADNTASAALRGVFPSRSANDAGGGDPGAYPMGEQGQMAPGGYAIPASDIASELLGLYDDQNLPERAMGYLLGSVPGMIPGVGNLVGRAMDFTPGPTAQRDFGRIGALAQKEAEQGIPFSQADDPFAEGDLPNSTLGWGLAERENYDTGRDPFGRGAAPASTPWNGVGASTSPFDANGQPAAPRGSTPAAAPVSLAPQTTPFGETINMTANEQPAKDAAWNDLPAQDKSAAPQDAPSTTSAYGGDKSTGSDATSPGDPGGPGPGSAESSGDAPGGDAPSGGGDGNGGGLGGQDIGGGDRGGPESGSLARGGRVTKRNAVRRGNPPGPDNIYATLQTGESVVPRDVTRGVQAGDPMSAMAALQSIGSGAPARRGAPAAKGKRPIAPRR